MNDNLKAKRHGRLSLAMGVFSILLPYFAMPVISGILIGCYGLLLSWKYWKVEDNAYCGFMISLLGILIDLYLLMLWTIAVKG